MSSLRPPSPLHLPIDDHLEAIVGKLAEHSSLVLTAPPGTGKTTRLPPALLAARDLGVGSLVLLEPRRMAVRAAARRLAEEWGWQVGKEVGYRIRFERRESRHTRLLVVTEGVLLRMLQTDPFLEGIDALVFDEIHERSLDADLALAMARRIQADARPELRLVAMSATLDPSPLQEFLGDCPALQLDTTHYPVEISYLGATERRDLPEVVRRSVEELSRGVDGNLLVFLPGMAEIRRCERALGEALRTSGTSLEVLHGGLPAAEQDAVLRPRRQRKVVLATNVAETSLTVPGVTAVIDSGLARVLRHDDGIGLDRLETLPIALANADQRAGRAGRERAGTCLRLWEAKDDLGRRPREIPEIHRLELAGVALQLLAWGETDLHRFPFFEAPEGRRLDRALELLELLGLVEAGAITRRGRKVARLPLHPRLGCLVLTASSLGRRELGCRAAAWLAEGRSSSRRSPQDRAPTTFSDLEAALDRLASDRSARRVLRAARQLAAIAGRLFESSKPPDLEDREVLGRSLLAGFPDRLARRRAGSDDRASVVGGRGLRLLPSSGVRDCELLLALEVDEGRRGRSSEGRLRLASGIEASWLPEARIVERQEISLQGSTRKVVQERARLWLDLELSRHEVPLDDAARAEEVLVEAARQELGEALDLDREEILRLRARIAFLRAHLPDFEPPAVDNDGIAELLPALAAGRRSFQELREAPLEAFLRGLLDRQQQVTLDREAPEYLKVPSGSRIRLQYPEGGPPVLAVRIQELFGSRDTPTVARGRVRVRLHLLAPNFRPQQVTDDLAGFWNRTYPEVRKELRGRYPKHAWPEDPLSAVPLRGAKRRRP